MRRLFWREFGETEAFVTLQPLGVNGSGVPATLVFFAINGQYLVVRSLLHTFEVVPAGTADLGVIAGDRVVPFFTTLFSTHFITWFFNTFIFFFSIEFLTNFFNVFVI